VKLIGDVDAHGIESNPQITIDKVLALLAEY
jgi:hypothetical protein